MNKLYLTDFNLTLFTYCVNYDNYQIIFRGFKISLSTGIMSLRTNELNIVTSKNPYGIKNTMSKSIGGITLVKRELNVIF